MSALRFLLIAAALLAPACSSGGKSIAPGATTQDAVATLDGAFYNGDDSDLARTQQILEDALARDPNDDLARTMLAMVRLVNFANRNADLVSLLQRYGFTFPASTSVFDMLLIEPPDQLPDNSPNLNEVQSWVASDLLMMLGGSIALLDDVSPSFSETVNFDNDPADPTDDDSVTIDYGIVKLISGGMRILVSVIEVTQVFDLDLDVDRVANHRFGVDIPYRIFSGPEPTNPGAASLCPTSPIYGSVDRAGFFNDPLAAGSRFGLPATDADMHLANIQDNLATAVRDIVEGLDSLLATYDPASCDPAVELICVDQETVDLYGLVLAPWLLDLADAIDGLDPTVEEVSFMLDGDTYELPELVLDALTLFASTTYGGRFYLPDYTLSASDCLADEDSFPEPTLSGLLPDMLAADWLELWNELNAGWDELMFGMALNDAY